MTRVEVRYETGEDTHVVGDLLSVRAGIFFQYNADFRKLGIELSPFKLPTSVETPVENRESGYAGLHGVFNDSLPDGWGMLLMDRALRLRRMDPERLTPVDRLAFLGTRTMGALTYHPPADPHETAEHIDLADAATQVDSVIEGSFEDVLPELLRAGGSPMGARPKIVAGVRDDYKRLVTGTSDLPNGYSHWLIKFTTKRDPSDTGAVEMAYAAMARAARISMPSTHLFKATDGRRHFGVQRFDRDPANSSRRVHMHTFAGLLHHDFRVPGQDYHDLLKVARVLTRDQRAVAEAFRRMVFNVLAHNRDDHTKNFTFLMAASGEWTLSPAYDVLYSHGPGGEHTMTIDGEGAAPTLQNILNVAGKASLPSREARQIIDEVDAAVAKWSAFAKKSGVLRATTARIARTIAETRRAALG